jgi:hypothetical protein
VFLYFIFLAFSTVTHHLEFFPFELSTYRT